MPSATVAAKVTVAKRLYPAPNEVAKPVYEKSRLSALAKKTTNKMGGEGRFVIIKDAGISGVGHTFQDALATQGTDTPARFFVQRRKLYVIGTIQNELKVALNGDKNSVLEAVRTEFDSARYAFARVHGTAVYGNGGGSLGQLHASVNLASTTLQFRNRTDMAGLERNYYLEFASDDGSGTSPAGRRSSGGVPVRLRVTGGIDRKAGTATVSALLNTVPSITANDYVSIRGSYAAAPTGIRGWLPASNPSASEDFFGVDRTDYDLTRVSGVRVNGNGLSKLEIMENVGADAVTCGLSGDMTMFVNPLEFRDIRKELGNAVQYMDVETKVGVGFKAIEFVSQTGVIKIISEVDCPLGYSPLIDTSDIEIASAGELPMELNYGNGQMLIAHDDDAMQFRFGAYYNVIDQNPGKAVIINWNGSD